MKHSLMTFAAFIAVSSSLGSQPDDFFMPYRDPRTAHMFQVDTIEVDGIVYERILDRQVTDRFAYYLHNIENHLGDEPYRLKDGSSPPKEEREYKHGRIDREALRDAVLSVFTAEENRLLGEEKAHIWMNMVFDVETGAVLEIDFVNRPTETMLSLPLSKFAALEKAIKRGVTTRVTDPETLELQFVCPLVILKFPLL